MVEGAPLERERVGGETKVLQTRDGRDVSRVFSKSFSPLRISCNFNRNLHFHKTSSTSRKKKRKKENENERMDRGRLLIVWTPPHLRKRKTFLFPPFFFTLFYPSISFHCFSFFKYRLDRDRSS